MNEYGEDLTLSINNSTHFETNSRESRVQTKTKETKEIRAVRAYHSVKYIAEDGIIQDNIF